MEHGLPGKDALRCMEVIRKRKNYYKPQTVQTGLDEWFVNYYTVCYVWLKSDAIELVIHRIRIKNINVGKIRGGQRWKTITSRC